MKPMKLIEYITFLSTVQPAFSMRSIILETGCEAEGITTYLDGQNEVVLFRTDKTLNQYAQAPHAPKFFYTDLGAPSLGPYLTYSPDNPILDLMAVVQNECEDVSDQAYQFIEAATLKARCNWAPFNVVTCEHFSADDGEQPSFHVDYTWVKNLSPCILFNGQHERIVPEHLYNIDKKCFNPILVYTLYNGDGTKYAARVADIKLKVPGWDYPDIMGVFSFSETEAHHALE